MSNDKTRREQESKGGSDAAVAEGERILRQGRWPLIAADAVAGVVAGGIAGMLAGPAGAVVGAAFGGVAAATAGAIALECADEGRQHDAELDVAIGVTDGNLGAASSDAPPSRTGTFSCASLGISGRGGETG